MRSVHHVVSRDGPVIDDWKLVVQMEENLDLGFWDWSGMSRDSISFVVSGRLQSGGKFIVAARLVTMTLASFTVSCAWREDRVVMCQWRFDG